MSLILGMQVGHDLYIGPDKAHVRIVSITNLTEFTVSVKDLDGIRSHTLNINDENGWEIYPGVVLRCGLRGSCEQARLVIEAPRELRILRGNIMRGLRKKTKRRKAGESLQGLT